MSKGPMTRQEWLDYLKKAVDEFDWEAAGQKWVGLTDAELAEFSDMKLGSYDLCLEVEAKLKEKNT